MEADWIKIFSTQELYKAKVLEALLNRHDIVFQTLNKQDSAYVVIGEIEIYIPAKDKDKAEELLKNHTFE